MLIEPTGAKAALSDLPRAGFAARNAAAVERLQAAAHASQAPVRNLLKARGVPHRPFWVVDAIWARVDAADLDALARLPQVARIRANPRLPAGLPEARAAGKSAQAVEWGVQRVDAPALWALGVRGEGVVIGGQDTGYAWDHPALQASYRGWNGVSADHDHHWHDAIHALIGPGPNDCGLDSPVPCDDHGHGTHTLGTMIGDDGGGNQIGVAPGARWIGCRNMEEGEGTPATYLECFQWFMAPTDLAGANPDPALAPHIINNSWGCPPAEGCTEVDILLQAVDTLRAAGILVVVSAGNSGPSCGSADTAPAPYPSSLSVGATDSADGIASFSSRGPGTLDGSLFWLKPELSAPGVLVRSSLPGGNYGASSGTSMAGPHVAGVAALLMSLEPRLKGDPAAVEAILMASARPMTSLQDCPGFPGAAVPNAVFGHGIVDAGRALALLAPLFRDGFEAPSP